MNYALTALAKELDEARQDLATFQRLTTAEERVQELARKYEATQAEYEKAEAANAAAELEARFARLSNIRVTNGSDPVHASGDNLLRQLFVVSWNAPKYDPRTGGSFIAEHSIGGLKSVPSNVLHFLIDRHPEQIPPAIMRLAPGNPRRAMNEYFSAVHRGYIKGAAA